MEGWWRVSGRVQCVHRDGVKYVIPKGAGLPVGFWQSRLYGSTVRILCYGTPAYSYSTASYRPVVSADASPLPISSGEESIVPPSATAGQRLSSPFQSGSPLKIRVLEVLCR